MHVLFLIYGTKIKADSGKIWELYKKHEQIHINSPKFTYIAQYDDFTFSQSASNELALS